MTEDTDKIIANLKTRAALSSNSVEADELSASANRIKTLERRAETAEAKLEAIRGIASWYNKETGKGGFDVDGEEFYIIRDILRGESTEQSIARPPRRKA
jgi:hypothetical protein